MRRRSSATGRNTASRWSSFVGREDLLQSLENALEAGESLALTGPNGIGKTTVLQALARSRRTIGETVLLAAGAEGERWAEGTLIYDLARQLPDAVTTKLPPADRELLRSDKQRELAQRGRLWLSVLEEMSAASPVLIIIDDVHWTDSVSLDTLSFATRRLPESQVRVAVAGKQLQSRETRVVPEPLQQIVVPPLTQESVAQLLEIYGIHARAAGGIYLDSGGNPQLVAALAGGASHRTSPAPSASSPLSPVVAALVHDRVDSLDRAQSDTLQLCALAYRPTVTLLQRAGRVDAALHIRQAIEIGLVAVRQDIIHFTPAAASHLLTADLTGQQRIDLHLKLADAVTVPEHRDLHLGVARPEPDAELAAQLAQSAHSAHSKGFSDLAAQLYALAADRTTVDDVDSRVNWLVQAAEIGASAGATEIVESAVDRVLATSNDPVQRVSARLALLNSVGHSVVNRPQALAAAQEDAADNPKALTKVRLWQAWTAVMAGDCATGVERGQQAMTVAQRTEDTHSESMAWAVSAFAARQIGHPDHREWMHNALAAEPSPAADNINTGPTLLGARAALIDDRLQDVGEAVGRLLAVADRSTPAGMVAVLRIQVELDLRRGRCREAVETSQRALDLACQNNMSPAPTWCTAAHAQLAGGSTTRGLALSEQAVRAAEQERDMTFMRLGLLPLGMAQLRLRRLDDAVSTLSQLESLDARLGIIDPTAVRYHGDLAIALAMTGQAERAAELVSRTRSVLPRFENNVCVSAHLDRGEAVICAAQDRMDEAEELAARAVESCSGLNMPLEQGYSLLIQAQILRQRRRHATARQHIQSAESIFRAHAAQAWLEHCATLLANLDGAPSASKPGGRAADPGARLTEAELRVSRLVAAGATNKEIAQQLYLSVKTVEATLTRVYRKVGVQSRTQLGAQLQHLNLT